MSLSTDWPIDYLSIWHLASITEKATNKSVTSNPLAEKPLTWEDQEELNFPDVRTFLCYIEAASKELYDSVMRL